MFKKTTNLIKYYILKYKDSVLSLFIEFVDPNLMPHLYKDSKPKSSKKK